MKPERLLLSPNYEISQVITGLWQVADLEKDGSNLDLEAAAENLVEYALEGFDTFDMADHYGSAELISGRAREILQLRQETCDNLNVARFHTKWCPKPGRMSPKVVRDAIDERADRLGVESVDLLQLHWWTFQHPGYLDAMEGLMLAHEGGRIANIGLTNFDTDHLLVLLRHGFPVVSNQVVVSLLDQRALGDMTTEVLKNGIKLFAYGVLAGGFLTERWLDKPEPGNSELNDWSKMKYKRFIDETGGWENLQIILRALTSVAQRHDVSVANVATRWVLDQPAVGAVIIGARLTESQHRQDNLTIFSFVLDEEDKSLIAESMADICRLKGDCGDEYREPPFLTATGDLSHHLDSLPTVYEPIAEQSELETGFWLVARPQPTVRTLLFVEETLRGRRYIYSIRLRLVSCLLVGLFLISSARGFICRTQKIVKRYLWFMAVISVTCARQMRRLRFHS